MSGTKQVVATKRIIKHGTTIGLNLGREFELLGVGYGDTVTVVITKEGER